jgi:hypothetical protein
MGPFSSDHDRNPSTPTNASLSDANVADADRFTIPAPSADGLVPWSGIAVRLLQGVIYSDESDSQWELLLSHLSAIADYFTKIGLQLILDVSDGMAYLKQSDDSDGLSGTGSAPVPRLFRRQPLSYEATLLCVLLRDELQQFEENEVLNERCIVPQQELFELWQAFFPTNPDELKHHRSLIHALHRLEEMKFVRQFERDPATWEVRRILKARLPLEDLDALRRALLDELAERSLRAVQEPQSATKEDHPSPPGDA